MLRFLNFYPSHQKTFAPGQRVRVRGEIRGGFLGREMVHPTFKAVTPGAPLPPSLTPVYPTTAQLPQPYLRKVIAEQPRTRAAAGGAAAAGGPGRTAVAARGGGDAAPPAGRRLAAGELEDGSHPAAQRLKFEELLAQQLSQLASRAERALLRAPEIAPRPGGLHEKLLAVLPFGLTGAQRRVVDEIVADLAGPRPMHRLLQGDVGAGKTVVAALAAAVAMDAGWQCALMAPTEILAEQHFAKLVQWLEPLGIEVAWLSGSRKGKARAKALAQAASGDGAADRRHARGDPGRRRVRATGAGHRRRAAPLRRAAAARAAPQAGHRGAGAAPADDDGHADPAHAGDDVLRRPGRQHDRRAAARAHAHRHARVRRHAPARRRRTHPRRHRRRPAGLLGLPADRGIGGRRERRRRTRRPRRAADAAERHRHPRRAAAALPGVNASACCMAA